MSIPKLLTKRPNENRLYAFDFTNLLGTSETISTVASVTADTPSGADALTIGSTSISGANAQVRLSGGTDGYTYTVTCQITTSASNTLEDVGRLKVDVDS